MSRRTKGKKNIVITFTKIEWDEEVQQEFTSSVTKEGPMTFMDALYFMNHDTHNFGLRKLGPEEGLYESDWMDVYENGSYLWKYIVKFEEV